MSLNKSIINIRVELQNRKLKKSGKNSFAGFSYFELSDFLPTLNELMKSEGINDIFSIENDYAVLKLVKDEDIQEYIIPYHNYETPVNKNGSPSMQDIQYFGAIITYYKRYLYMNAFGITDGEVIDAMEKIPEQPKKTVKTKNDGKSEEHKKEIWGKFNDDLKHEEIDLKKFLEFYDVKMTQKVKLMKFVEEYTSDSDLRNQLVMDYKNSL